MRLVPTPSVKMQQFDRYFVARWTDNEGQTRAQWFPWELEPIARKFANDRNGTLEEQFGECR